MNFFQNYLPKLYFRLGRHLVRTMRFEHFAKYHFTSLISYSGSMNRRQSWFQFHIRIDARERNLATPAMGVWDVFCSRHAWKIEGVIHNLWWLKPTFLYKFIHFYRFLSHSLLNPLTTQKRFEILYSMKNNANTYNLYFT